LSSKSPKLTKGMNALSVTQSNEGCWGGSTS
jgi:hypothetical protein